MLASHTELHGVGRGFYLCPKFSTELNITSTNPLCTQHSRPLLLYFILITIPNSELQITPQISLSMGKHTRSAGFQDLNRDHRAPHNLHPPGEDSAKSRLFAIRETFPRNTRLQIQVSE